MHLNVFIPIWPRSYIAPMQTNINRHLFKYEHSAIIQYHRYLTRQHISERMELYTLSIEHWTLHLKSTIQPVTIYYPAVEQEK